MRLYFRLFLFCNFVVGRMIGGSVSVVILLELFNDFGLWKFKDAGSPNAIRVPKCLCNSSVRCSLIFKVLAFGAKRMFVDPLLLIIYELGLLIHIVNV